MDVEIQNEFAFWILQFLIFNSCFQLFFRAYFGRFTAMANGLLVDVTRGPLALRLNILWLRTLARRETIRSRVTSGRSVRRPVEQFAEP